jgi:hypothetical protein
MRPCAVASRPRPLLAPMGAQRRPVPLGLRPGRHAEGGAVPAPLGVGATPQRAKRTGLNPRARARLRGRIPEDGAPAPRSGAQAAALPSSTISTYGLPRAPCIRSVLATTHHAPIYEIGSFHFTEAEGRAASRCSISASFSRTAEPTWICGSEGTKPCPRSRCSIDFFAWEKAVSKE